MIISNNSNYYTPFNEKYKQSSNGFGDLIDKGQDGQHTESPKTEDPPLTQDEKRLAYEWRVFSTWKNSLLNVSKALRSGDEHAINQASEDLMALGQGHRHLLNNPESILWQFKAENGGIVPASIKPSTIEIAFSENRFPYQSLRVNSATNSMTIGRGSTLLIDGFRFTVERFIIQRDLTNDNRNLPESVSQRVRDFSDFLSTLSNGHGVLLDPNHEVIGEYSRNVLSILQDLGIDTSRSFTINGIRFTARDGEVYTADRELPPRIITSPEERAALIEAQSREQQERWAQGKLFLNKLVLRAYEQNLF